MSPREIGILFSAPMVLAIRAGQKTQTRRLLNPQPPAAFGWYPPLADGAPLLKRSRGYAHEAHFRRGFVEDFGRWKVGERLWVRETWRPWIRGVSSHVQYRADNARSPSLGPDASDAALAACEKNGGHWDDGRCQNPAEVHWRPAIFMPRWASREVLDVSAVRVQRLQEITRDDARAEGVCTLVDYHDHLELAGAVGAGTGDAEIKVFARLWDSINGAKPGCSWGENPWVTATTFSRVTA